MEEQRDEKLWQIAKHRADFQNSLIGFVVIVCICWLYVILPAAVIQAIMALPGRCG